MQTTFGVKEIGQLIIQLKAENNPDNDKLIKFYEKKISEAIGKAYNTALKQLKAK